MGEVDGTGERQGVCVFPITGRSQNVNGQEGDGTLRDSGRRTEGVKEV